MIITKEKEENLGLNQAEFPKLIIEEEKIIKKEVESQAEQNLSTREIIAFLLFCTFFIVVVYMQLNIGSSFLINSAIKESLKSKNNFQKVNTEEKFYSWLEQFVQDLYVDKYYNDFTIPDNKQFAIPNLNVIESPLRITQRRMKLVPNEDQYTKDIIPDKWANLGFDIYDSYNSEVESNSVHNNTYYYTSPAQTGATYQDYGGYVELILLQNRTLQQTLDQIQSFRDKGFINNQTRYVVIDCVIYNQFSDFYSILNLIAKFEANGLISPKIDLINIQKEFYKGTAGYIRLICEILFCLLFAYYLIIEIFEIQRDIKNKKKELKKEAMKLKAKKNRENEAQDPDKKKKSKNSSSSKVEKSSAQSNLQDVNVPIYKYFIGGIKDHYDSLWNWIDTAFLLLSAIAISIWATIFSVQTNKLSKLEIEDFQNIENIQYFYRIGNLMTVYGSICSINFTILFIKVLKYLASWLEKVMIIFRTLSSAQSDVFYFLIMYILILLAFVVMCHVYYGADLTDFGTIMNSLKTLFQMLLGDLVYNDESVQLNKESTRALDDMIILNKTLTFIFFVAFMTSMQFILVNMFIAIISNAYSDISKEMKQKSNSNKLKPQTHILVRIADKLRCRGSKGDENKGKKKKDKQLNNLNRKNKAQMSQRQKRQDDDDSEDVQSEENDRKVNLKEEKDPFKDKHNKNKSKSSMNKRKKSKKEDSENSSDSEDNTESSEEEKFEKDKKAKNKGDKSENDKKSKNQKGSKVKEEQKESKSKSKKKKKRSEESKTGSDGDDRSKNNDKYDNEDIKQKVMQREEDERNKKLLNQMKWDTEFDENVFNQEEQIDLALQSEKQEVERKKEQELKCGKIMWASISFTLYAILYIALILYQLNVERNFWYNEALKEVVENQLNATIFRNSNGDFQYQKNYQMDYSDVVHFLQYDFKNVAQNQSYSEGFSAFYIQQMNYVLNNQFRLCFVIEKAGTENIPNDDFIFQETDLPSTTTNLTYKYYAQGFQDSGSLCQDILFEPEDYDKYISTIINDQLISDRMYQLSLEYVTFEGSQQVHSYTSIIFDFPIEGITEITINVDTMRLNPYKKNSDFLRLAFEGLYILLLTYNIVIFFQGIRRKNDQYNRWKRIEIDSLTEIEKKHRQMKRPEWIRKWTAIFQVFTYFDIIYFTLAITSIIQWVIYVSFAAKLDFELPPPTNDFIPKFYEAQKLLTNYSVVVAINTIFLSSKVFDYMNKSKQMNVLSLTLESAKSDMFYYLIIFSIFLLGFVGMAYVSFGAQLESYSNIGGSIWRLIEITIGDFDYRSLDSVNKVMAFIFFFSFNILFVFILTNIFLAIINEAYENKQEEEKDEENLNILSSVFYCLIPNDKNKNNRKLEKGIEKNAQQQDYLDVFEKLSLNLQVQKSDLKAWAVNCADEIKSELSKRTQLRHQARDALLTKYKGFQPNEQEGKNNLNNLQSKKFDEIECFKKRLQYWDYIRNGIQFFGFQNKTLEAVRKQKELEIQEQTKLYEESKKKSEEIQKYIAKLEEPLGDKLKTIKEYKDVLKKLEDQKKLLMKADYVEEDEEEDDDDNMDSGRYSNTRK